MNLLKRLDRVLKEAYRMKPRDPSLSDTEPEWQKRPLDDKELKRWEWRAHKEIARGIERGEVDGDYTFDDFELYLQGFLVDARQKGSHFLTDEQIDKVAANVARDLRPEGV